MRTPEGEITRSSVTPLTDREYAECFNAFKKVSTEWAAIKDWLSKEFMPLMAGAQSANVLGVGSGTGDFDLTLIRILLEKIHHISYVALDPNEEHNQIFLDRYKKSGLQLASFQIVPKPFEDDDLDGGFDLIHLTHCLYYIPDKKKAIQKAYDLLNPGGFLLIFHQTPLGINEIQRAYMKRIKGDEKEMFSTHDILIIFEELGLKFNFDVLISDIDVTDCIEDDEVGKKLLNFFLESNLEGLDPSLRKEIVHTLKETCQFREGRYHLFHPSGIFWIRKDAG
jgi:SAM-dependent methyltransferase